MQIPDEHVNKVCRPGQKEKTCSFLMFGDLGFECAKRTDAENFIRWKRDQDAMYAKGDNCEGPPDFKAVEPRNN